MSELLRRSFDAQLLVRAGADGSPERVIEGVVVPFGQVATVRDTPDGPIYRETIARGALDAVDWSRVKLEVLDTPPRSWNTHEGSRLVGRAIEASSTDDGQRAAFRVARTAAGDDALELARDGILEGLSVNFRPISERRRADGVLERTAIDVRRVALVASGAYEGAQVTAVRAATEGEMPGAPTPQTAAPTDPEEETEEGATPTPPKERPNRTRVTVDVERAQAERETVAELSRGPVPQIGRSPITVSRAELVYGPTSEHSYLHDAWMRERGDSGAAERFSRHEALLSDLAIAMERNGARDLARAGDVTSGEIPGAYPSDYLPGLLTPRILKGRPMGGFYNRVPISDARPKIFAKVTTSTTAAVQAAEGTNPAASDLATTAVTVTPLLYGAETVVSRQVLDGGDPSAESMIMQDMVEAYAQASETVIKTAVEAGAGASGVAITAATPFAGTVGNVVAYQAARFSPALGQFVPPALYAVLLAQADTAGRPLLPWLGPQNADGTLDAGATGASILGARTHLSWASTVNVVVTGRPADYVIYESAIARFSFDAVTGPAGVRVGIWAYLVVGARLGSLKVTAA